MKYFHKPFPSQLRIQPLGSPVCVAASIAVDDMASQGAVQVYLICSKILGHRGRYRDCPDQANYYQRMEMGEGHLKVPFVQVGGETQVILILNREGLPQHGTDTGR